MTGVDRRLPGFGLDLDGLALDLRPRFISSAPRLGDVNIRQPRSMPCAYRCPVDLRNGLCGSAHDRRSGPETP